MEIGAEEAPRVLVLGEGGPDRRGAARRAERRHPDAVLVSALTGEGMAELTERIEDEFARTLQEIELLIPYDEGGRLAELHEIAGDLERRRRQRACASSPGSRRPSPRGTQPFALRTRAA